MMRVLSHIGLSLALLVAPALCCCNLRWMAAAGEPAHCPTCPPPAAKPTCCHKSCGHEAEPETAPAQPAKSPTQSCCCNTDRPVGANTVTKPVVADPEFTGEVIAFTPASAAPVHAGLAGGLDPPERAGVDARYAALFERHVLRC